MGGLPLRGTEERRVWLADKLRHRCLKKTVNENINTGGERTGWGA